MFAAGFIDAVGSEEKDNAARWLMVNCYCPLVSLRLWSVAAPGAR